MTAFTSYTRLEKEYQPDFRNKISMARSTNEVYDVFCHTVALMLNEILGDKRFVETDIDFFPERPSLYELGDKVRSVDGAEEIMASSDLSRILDDFAHTAANRYTHLLKHPEKTNAKMMRH